MNIPANFRKKHHPLGLIYRLTSKFEYYKTTTLICDYHIIGNNPIMELLFLYFLSNHLNQNTNNIKRKESILFSRNSQLDYWAYSEIDNPSFFQKLSSVLEQKVSDIYEFINLVIRKIPQDKLNIYYHENELHPQYFRLDEVLNEMIISFHPQNKKKTTIKNDVAPIIIFDNEVKDIIQKKLNNYVYSLSCVEDIKNNFPDEPFKTLSKKTLLTSLPQGRIDSKVFTHQNLLDREMCFFNFFSERGEVIGSAYHISSDINESKILAHNDLDISKKTIIDFLKK